MKNEIKLVELFSGIGSQAKSLKRISKKYNLTVDLAATCEWDIHAGIAYYFLHGQSMEKLNYPTKSKIIDFLFKKGVSYNGKTPLDKLQIHKFNDHLLKLSYEAIRGTNNFVDINKLKGKDLPNNIDILTYSFPCQDLSNVGAFHGFKHGIDRNANTRSGLLWQVERLLKELRQNLSNLPKFLVMENVSSLYAPRHIKHFEEWKKILSDLGYVNHDELYRADRFGVPQMRKRVIMLSILSNKKQEINDFITTFNKNYKFNKLKSLKEFIDISNNNFDEKILAQPNKTPSRMKIWKENNKLVNKKNEFAHLVNTITTKQDRHPNSGNIYFNYKGNVKSKYRFLTARESLLLMGFDNSDYDKLIANNFFTKKNSTFFSRDVIYKLAGNSIVVDVLDYIFELIIEIRENFK